MSILADLKFILPEIILLICALAVLFLGLFVKKKSILGVLSLAGLILAGLLLPQSYISGTSIFFNILVSDSFSEFFKYLFLLTAAIVILISIGYKRILKEDRGEYYFLLLILTIAMMLAVSSHNLLMIYIAIEAVSLLAYILTAFRKNDLFSSEGALKYFLFGSLTSAVMLYGISFVYGLFGTLDLSTISASLNQAQNNFAVFVPLLFIFSGLSFKCALVPFHMWVPDAYQGAPTPVTALISVGPKAVGFAVLLRIFLCDIFISTDMWVCFVTAVSIFTMTLGNIIAITQTNVKRLLGYSSIAQAGYILIGFVVATPLGIKAVLFYLFTYLFMNLGAFACVALISESIKSHDIEDYAGFYKRQPFTAFVFTVFLLSLAGIPPLGGFMAKFLVFAAAIEARFIMLAVIGVINSVVALYYYVKIIRFMYLSEPKETPILPRPFALNFALVIAFVSILVIGLWPCPVLNWINGLQF
ncbi:MAG: NADH-quinone oxidoreductase subunit N [Candidatus Omnitrophota bacterium]|nr:NADH-quinone oxidoreductase subunit N [Candidatus Omnitrophota bacterium]